MKKITFAIIDDPMCTLGEGRIMKDSNVINNKTSGEG